MKKINVMMASLATLLIAGCAQNEVTEISPDANPTIGFGVYTGVPTRGTNTTTTTMQKKPTEGGGFGIMGYYTGQDDFEDVKASVKPNFMHNQLVEWNASLNSNLGGWTYTPLKYWPNREGDKLSFFAYAPYESDWQSGTNTGVTVSAIDAEGIPYINFKLKDAANLDKMVDLVVADKRDMSYTSDEDSKIKFTFEHTLARVGFRAQLGSGSFEGMDGTNSFVYITRMWIVGTDHTAQGSNLSLITGTSTVNKNSKFYTSAKWSELRWNYENAVVPAADFNLEKMLNVDAGITESNAPGGHSGTVKGIKITKDSQGDANKAVSLFKPNQYLYLIPIGETASTQPGCAEGDIMIGFHYDIVSKNTSAGSTEYIASHAESFIKLPAQHMKRKESYLYTLVINLHEIKIGDTTVTPWTDSSVEVPVE